MQRQLSDERRVRFQFGEKINVKCQMFWVWWTWCECQMSGQGRWDQDVGHIPSETGRPSACQLFWLEPSFVLYIDPKTKHSFAVPSNSRTFCLLSIFLLLLEMCKRCLLWINFLLRQCFCSVLTSSKKIVIYIELEIIFQLLFDELEDLDERLRTFKADAKSENTSVKVGCLWSVCSKPYFWMPKTQIGLFKKLSIWFIVSFQALCAGWYHREMIK